MRCAWAWMVAIACALGCGRNALHEASSLLDAGDDAAVPTQWQWACPRETPTGPVVPALVTHLDQQVVMVMSDRSTRVLYRFESLPEASLPRGYYVTATRGGIVASASSRMFGAPRMFVQADVLVALTFEGQLQWRRTYVNDDLGPSHHRTIPLWLNHEGVFALHAEPLHDSVIWSDGREEMMQGVVPIARPFANGLTPVQTRDAPHDWHWYVPGEADLRPLAATPGGAPRVVGDRLIYFSDDGGDLTLVIEDGGPTARHIAIVPQVDATPLWWDAQDNAEGWLVLPEGAGLYHVPSGERRVVPDPLLVPDGLERFGGLAVDFDGALLMPLRNKHWAALFRLDLATLTWQQIGKRLAEIDSIGFIAREGTYLIHATGNDELFVPQTTWEPANSPSDTPELLNGSEQLLRPATSIAFESAELRAFYGPASSLAPNGLCAAIWTDAHDGSNNLTLFDLERGERFTVLRSAVDASPNVGEVAWIEHAVRE